MNNNRLAAMWLIKQKAVTGCHKQLAGRAPGCRGKQRNSYMRTVNLIKIVLYIPQHIRCFHYRGRYDLYIFFGSNGYIYQGSIRKVTKSVISVTNASLISHIKTGSHA